MLEVMTKRINKEEVTVVTSLIDCGWGYEQIKNFIFNNSAKQIAG